MCLFPGHKIVFVELKTTGRKPKRIQAYMHNKLRALGFRVEVIDSVEGVEQFIDSIISVSYTHLDVYKRQCLSL